MHSLIINLIFMIVNCYSLKSILLSSGLYKWSDKQLDQQYNYFSVYKKLNLITEASILTYVINTDGMVELIQTNSSIDAEQYQYNISKNLNLLAYPCIFCDASIGFCSGFDDIINAVFKNQQRFIDDLIERSIKYNWSGYTIDFEPDRSINGSLTTNLMVQLAKKLDIYKKKLYIWINYGVNVIEPFNISHLMTIHNIVLLTMNTYNSDYNLFIETASSMIIHSKSFDRIGFGLLTYDRTQVISEDSMMKIVAWLKVVNISLLSLWASTIPPNWFLPLNNYMN
jgi:hypothetical protein